jgi:putative transposase
MPEHVHLLVFPEQADSRVESLLYAIKRPFSFRVKQQLLSLNDPLLAHLTIRERPGKETFRFWQEGGGYDRNITSVDAIHVAADYIHLNPVRRDLCSSAEQWKWSSLKTHQGLAQDPDLPVVKLPWLG